jgi:hypothetical protein
LAAGVQTADRGIGGTGIIGVITGFASICVGGQEVGYDPALPVTQDGQPARAADLRAGQLALVEATGPDTGLVARSVRIRHEVVGPVQASAVDDGAAGLGYSPGWRMLRVAGQLVAVSPATLGDGAPAAGSWVAVSGFRDADGVVHATRIDPWQPGPAVISGRLVLEGGHFRIGTAEIVPGPGVVLMPGLDVVLVGRWSDGVLYLSGLEPDLLVGQPAAYFGPAIGFVVVESFAGLNDGRLVLGRVRQGRAGDVVQRSVVEMSRRPDGALQPAIGRALGAGVRAPGRDAASDRGFGGARGGYRPAPVPHFGTGDAARAGFSRGGDAAGRDNRARYPFNRGDASQTPGGDGPAAGPAGPGPSGFGYPGPGGGFPGGGFPGGGFPGGGAGLGRNR